MSIQFKPQNFEYYISPTSLDSLYTEFGERMGGTISLSSIAVGFSGAMSGSNTYNGGRQVNLNTLFGLAGATKFYVSGGVSADSYRSGYNNPGAGIGSLRLFDGTTTTNLLYASAQAGASATGCSGAAGGTFLLEKVSDTQLKITPSGGYTGTNGGVGGSVSASRQSSETTITYNMANLVLRWYAVAWSDSNVSSGNRSGGYCTATKPILVKNFR